MFVPPFGCCEVTAVPAHEHQSVYLVFMPEICEGIFAHQYHGKAGRAGVFPPGPLCLYW
jgi:hypothetical protein